MALKTYLFADMLAPREVAEIGGVGGLKGDIARKAPVHAGLTDPTGAMRLSPPTPAGGAFGDAANSGGHTKTEYPCGLPEGDPTAPTVPSVPSVLKGIGSQARLASPAANDSGAAPDAAATHKAVALHPDTGCWPDSAAMNTEEIRIFTMRLGHFTSRGEAAAEALADKLLLRDRDFDERRLCAECRHCDAARRCGHRQAVREVFHRCDYFAIHPHLEGRPI